MADVKGIGGGGNIPPQRTGQTSESIERAKAQPGVRGGDAPVGQPGALGQPTGLPAPVAPGQAKLMTDALAGRDASQMVSAERMRAAGGASAIEELLGLNRQPSIVGAFAQPPGNSEALRHMTPTIRRTIMRALLNKQRERMRRLARLSTRQRDEGQTSDDAARERDPHDPAEVSTPPDDIQLARAQRELACAVRMLNLLEELLVMQDYTFSQMGTFSQG